MQVEREIGGVLYVCDKLPAEAGLALFVRASATLAGTEGLFAAIALADDNRSIISEWFAYAKTMDPAALHALVVELAGLCRRAEDGGKPEPADARELLELAFLALGTQFHDFFPVLPDGLFPSGEDVAEAA